jgi:hypothetical protein
MIQPFSPINENVPELTIELVIMQIRTNNVNGCEYPLFSHPSRGEQIHEISVSLKTSKPRRTVL